MSKFLTSQIRFIERLYRIIESNSNAETESIDFQD
jgi:hypothetical protein